MTQFTEYLLRDSDHSRRGHFYTSEIEREVFRILRNIRAKENYMEQIKALYRAGQMVAGVKRLRIIEDDPDDDKYPECAEKCLADYIITNDRHLLKLKSFQGTEIVRPVEFMLVEDDEPRYWKSLAAPY